jgi:hypothetical protein
VALTVFRVTAGLALLAIGAMFGMDALFGEREAVGGDPDAAALVFLVAGVWLVLGGFD